MVLPPLDGEGLIVPVLPGPVHVHVGVHAGRRHGGRPRQAGAGEGSRVRRRSRREGRDGACGEGADGGEEGREYGGGGRLPSCGRVGLFSLP